MSIVHTSPPRALSISERHGIERSPDANQSASFFPSSRIAKSIQSIRTFLKVVSRHYFNNQCQLPSSSDENVSRLPILPFFAVL